MSGNKTYRQVAGGQRFHKHRLGRLMVPHGRVSGLLFTVNPRQESKALRELQLYLHPLIADLEETYKKKEQETTKVNNNNNNEGDQECPLDVSTGTSARGNIIAAPSTSSLLAAELAEYVPNHVRQRGDEIKRSRLGERREERKDEEEESSDSDDNDNNNENANNNNNNNNGDVLQSSERKRKRDGGMETSQRSEKNCNRWLAPLETGCKGHLMISIPFDPRDDEEEQQQQQTQEEKEDEETSRTAGMQKEEEDNNCGVTGETPVSSSSLHGQNRRPPHAIQHNPMVRTVVERIFKDIEENPRPLLRNCFRLMPCELTCCPTLSEMRLGLGRLLDFYYPPTDGPQQLRRVSLSFKVKNNTGVERTKLYTHAVLETVFPVNRFVVIPAARLKSCDGGVEAVFCVLVVHATCAMGVQRCFSERGEYNLHALGAKHLELSSSV